jgi:hypothetical protein
VIPALAWVTRDWLMTLLLLLAYSIYLPHLFLRVGELKNALAGPLAGWELLLGLGFGFWLTIPLFGDLAFWIASVLFATHHFRGALIASGIALGLCGIFYSLFVIGGGPGGYCALGLRFVSMGLLFGAAWVFS